MVLSPSLLQNRKGLLILLLVLAIVVVIFALVYVMGTKNSLKNVGLFQKGPKVSTKTGYENPFDKKTQYVNPFESYKNPFVVAK